MHMHLMKDFHLHREYFPTFQDLCFHFLIVILQKHMWKMSGKGSHFIIA